MTRTEARAIQIAVPENTGLLTLSNSGADDKTAVRLHFVDTAGQYGEADVLDSLALGQSENIYLTNIARRIKLFRISWKDPCAGVRRRSNYSEEKAIGYRTISINWYGTAGEEEDNLLLGQ